MFPPDESIRRIMEVHEGDDKSKRPSEHDPPMERISAEGIWKGLEALGSLEEGGNLFCG